MKTFLRMSPGSKKLLSLIGAVVVGCPTLLADTVVVESRESGGGAANCPPFCKSTGWSPTTLKSTAVGTTADRGGGYYSGNSAPTFSLQPTLAVAGGDYFVEATHGSPDGNNSADLMMSITVTGGSGLPATTDCLQRGKGVNSWYRIGTLTLAPGVTQPTLAFAYSSGSVASSASGNAGRMVVDAFRFVYAGNPCLNGLPEIQTVNGPLGAGQTFVEVPNVSALATKITVYASDVVIGERTSGIVAGVNRVTTSPLVKDTIIKASQWDANGVESCIPLTGLTVGGGANPRIRVSLSIRQNATLAGPIGANGGNTNATLKFLGATNTYNGLSAQAPMGGKVVQPGACWQTVTFLRGEIPASPTDPTFGWSGTSDGNNLYGDFGVLESIAFAIDNLTDTGPFRLYIDNFQNGDVIVQDFEAATNGQQTVMFLQPSFSGTTGPFLMAPLPGSISPNISQVTTAQSDTGEKSLLLSWQFKDFYPGNWLRLVAQGSDTPNVQLDLRLPISFRILLLPPYPTNSPLQITSQPQSKNVIQGQPASLQVTPCGTPPFSYQWYQNGAPLAGATNATYSIAVTKVSDSGVYHVAVTDATTTINSVDATLIVEPYAVSDVLVPLWQLAPGSRPYLASDSSQGGLAVSPTTGNLLVASRNALGVGLYVLDGNTGADIRTLNTDPNTIYGGEYVLHQVGTLSDGQIFAANMTTNSALSEFKIYQWLDDGEGGYPYLTWMGNPGGITDSNRWGDTMAVRDFDFGGGAPYAEIIIGSYADNKVAVIRTISSTDYYLFTVTGAPPGAFSHGIAWGEGNTFWGKSYNGALYRVALDFDLLTATVLNVYNSLPTLAPIGIENASALLAGVSIYTPDTLRLLDMANLGVGPVALDAKNFPTDNKNPAAAGAVDFSPGRVYALDANNGIVAMTVRPILRVSRDGSQMTLKWSGPYTLQSAPDVTGEYTDVDGATNPYPVDVSAAGQRYYRLRQ